MTARFVAEARAELLEQADDYDEKQPGLGQRFINEVERAVDFASRFPMAGSPWLHDTRRVFTQRFPFAVVYRPGGRGRWYQGRSSSSARIASATSKSVKRRSPGRSQRSKP
jgi:plasmid stabilization system protein ParE